MASKDNKTSKTARVMNLLSKKQEPAADEAAAGAAPAQAAVVPPIVSSLAPDAAVSVQIKNALEDALEGELGAAAPPEPSQTVEPEPPAAAPVQPAPVDEPAPQPVEAQQPAPAAEPAAESAHTWAEPVNPGYMNVMQVLVEEKAPKYVKMFGLCSCKRCMEDVKAITLNHLAPKYVVLERGDMVPRLTVYESKFSSDITAQLLQACKLVNERPHHSR